VTRSGALALAVLAAVVVGCGDSGRDDRDAAVAAVIKGVENPFFATMRDGLVATARRRDARLELESAAGLEDTAGQASALESLATRRPGCLLVNPITRTNLIEPLSHAPEGTPVVNIDSPVDPQAAKAADIAITTYIGTDNVAAGRLAADAMAGFVERGGRVAVIGGIPGDSGSGDRTLGFRQGARDRFDVTETIAADFVRERARLAAEELLRADPRVDGFFAVNDEMALGIARAVRAARRTGDVAVIGMDGIRQALAAIERGAMSATVAQYPYAMGQLGVEACLAAMRGKDVPSRIDAPIQIVTTANVLRARANFPQPAKPFDDPFKD
jgi:ABC-type sugar transport system substrate-binding protein